MKRKAVDKLFTVVALGAAFYIANADDRIYYSGFENLPVLNIIGAGDGEEGFRIVTADVCDEHVDRVDFVYDTTGTGALRKQTKRTVNTIRMIPAATQRSKNLAGKNVGDCENFVRYEVSEPASLTYDTALELHGRVASTVKVRYLDGTEYSSSIETAVMYASEDTAQGVLEDILPTYPRLLGLQFDVNYTCNGIADGPYNAIAFNQSTGNFFGLLYRMEDHDRLKNHLLSCSSEFHTIEQDSIAGVLDQVNEKFSN